MRSVVRTLVAWLIFAETLAGQQDPRIQKLIEQLGDKTRWTSASKQLQAIGNPAVKPLLTAIQTDDGIKDTPLTRRALEVLGNMGPAANAAYSELLDAVPGCEPKIYIRLLHTLGDLVPYSESQGNKGAVQALVQASIGAIRAMGHGDRRRWNTEYRRFSVRLQVDPEAGLEAMIKELQKNQAFRREVAAEVLGRMGASAKDAIPVLAASLWTRGTYRAREGKDDFGRRAAEAMIQIAPGDARCATAYSYRLLHSASDTERAEAALRIGGFGKAAKSEVSRLIRAFGDRSHRVRCEAITALGMIGAAAKAAVPRLEGLSDSKDKAIAVRAKAALKQISGR